ncbi:TPA: phage antirepressor KilAC domain-containing protein [Citrobacter koseri]
MSQLIVNGVVTMSSRDIADLVQSKHSDVKRSAERLVAAGILTAPLAQFDFEHLIERNILYRLGGTLTPMAQHISAGRFEVKTGTSSASNHAFSQTRFTAKGVRWIGGL